MLLGLNLGERVSATSKEGKRLLIGFGRHCPQPLITMMDLNTGGGCAKLPRLCGCGPKWEGNRSLGPLPNITALHLLSGNNFNWGLLMSDVWEFREQVPHDGQQWGRWHFDQRSRWLVYDDDEGSLCIDLTAIDGSARMLDWIFWMNDHDWYTREELADLIQAFDEIFYPRVNLCPNGRDRAMDAKKYLDVMSGIGKSERKAA